MDRAKLERIARAIREAHGDLRKAARALKIQHLLLAVDVERHPELRRAINEGQMRRRGSRPKQDGLAVA